MSRSSTGSSESPRHQVARHSAFTQQGIGFLAKMIDVIFEEVIVEGCADDNIVVDFEQPEDLRRRLDLRIGGAETIVKEDRLLEICRDVARSSVKTGNHMFLNQLYQGLDAHGLGAALLTEALHTNQFTFEVAPALILIEEVMLQKIRHLVGYPISQADGGDGIFCPGGSISNMYALNLARFKKFPDVKRKGMREFPKMVVFTSRHSHFSIKKGVLFMGMGTESLVVVDVDSRGRMIPEKLERAVEEAEAEGAVPIMVNATSGTTVLGAYDPLEDIARICLEHKIWLHVDACWGGGALVSRNRRHLMTGVEKSDSIAWCFHKMLGSPMQCSPFVTKHHGLLADAHSTSASYLYQRDKYYDVSFDVGDKSIQCGRKPDAFKMWAIWKAKGDEGLEAEIDAAFELAEYFDEQVRRREGFVPVTRDSPQCTNVCFWYIPKRLRAKAPSSVAASIVGNDFANHNGATGAAPALDAADAAWWSEVGKVAPAVKGRLVKSGSLLIGYQPLDEKPNFFRFVLSRRPTMTRWHMDKILEEIQSFGEAENDDDDDDDKDEARKQAKDCA